MIDTTRGQLARLPPGVAPHSDDGGPGVAGTHLLAGARADALMPDAERAAA